MTSHRVLTESVNPAEEDKNTIKTCGKYFRAMLQLFSWTVPCRCLVLSSQCVLFFLLCDDGSAEARVNHTGHLKKEPLKEKQDLKPRLQAHLDRMSAQVDKTRSQSKGKTHKNNFYFTKNNFFLNISRGKKSQSTDVSF